MIVSTTLAYILGLYDANPAQIVLRNSKPVFINFIRFTNIVVLHKRGRETAGTVLYDGRKPLFSDDIPRLEYQFTKKLCCLYQALTIFWSEFQLHCII